MKLLLALLITSYTQMVLAHEIIARHENLQLVGPDTAGFTQLIDGYARFEKMSLGLGASHLERYDHVEQQMRLHGGIKTGELSHKVSLAFTREALFLAQRQLQLETYLPIRSGLSIFVNARGADYFNSDLWQASLGVELESRGWVLVPQLGGGRASFKDANETQGLMNWQLRLMYYRQDAWKFWVFGAGAQEAQAQAIPNQSEIYHTKTYGAGGMINLTPKWQIGLDAERVDFEDINVRFEQIAINLHFNWGNV